MNSDEYSTDEGVKKRSRENEDGVFGQSKKTPRTPSKSSSKREEKLDQILTGMANLSFQVQQLTAELHLAREEQRHMADEVKAIREENAKLKELGEKAKKENEKLREEVKEVKLRLEKLEKQKRENNIVISGLSIERTDVAVLREGMENFLKETLEVDVKVKAAHKLGPKVCLAEMENKEDKIKVMRNKNKLKILKDDKVFINNDLTLEERTVDKRLRVIAKEVRNQGRTVRIGYNKLIIEGKEHKWDKDKGVLEGEDSLKISQKN